MSNYSGSHSSYPVRQRKRKKRRGTPKWLVVALIAVAVIAAYKLVGRGGRASELPENMPEPAAETGEKQVTAPEEAFQPEPADTFEAESIAEEEPKVASLLPADTSGLIYSGESIKEKYMGYDDVVGAWFPRKDIEPDGQWNDSGKMENFLQVFRDDSGQICVYAFFARLTFFTDESFACDPVLHEWYFGKPDDVSFKLKESGEGWTFTSQGNPLLSDVPRLFDTRVCLSREEKLSTLAGEWKEDAYIAPDTPDEYYRPSRSWKFTADGGVTVQNLESKPFPNQPDTIIGTFNIVREEYYNNGRELKPGDMVIKGDNGRYYDYKCTVTGNMVYLTLIGCTGDDGSYRSFSTYEYIYSTLKR